MKVTYDKTVDAAYIQFSRRSASVTTQRLSEDIAVNYDRNSNIVGIEVLSASEHLFSSSKNPTVEIGKLQVKHIG